MSERRYGIGSPGCPSGLTLDELAKRFTSPGTGTVPDLIEHIRELERENQMYRDDYETRQGCLETALEERDAAHRQLQEARDALAATRADLQNANASHGKTLLLCEQRVKELEAVLALLEGEKR